LSAGASAAPGRDGWRALAVLTLAAALAYTDRQILNLLVDPIRHDFAITDLQISFLQGAAFAFIYAAMGLPLGRWADSHNRRNLVAGGIALWSLATAACGLAHGFSELFVARMFVGVGEAALAPAALSLISDYFAPSRRGTAIGIFLAGMVGGTGVAILLGGALRSLFESGWATAVPLLGGLAPWRAVLIVLGCAGLVVAALAAGIREPERDRLVAVRGASSAGVSLPQVARYLVINATLFVPAYFALTVGNMADYGIGAWYPSLLMRVFTYSPLDVATHLGALAIVLGGLGTISGGLLADSFERRGRLDGKLLVAVGGTALAALAIACCALGSAVTALAAYAVYSLMNSAASTAGIAAMQDVVPNRMRGLTTAIQSFLFTALGLGIGPSLVALATMNLFGGTQGVGHSIAVVDGTLLAGVAVLFALARGPYRRHRVAKGTPA
jgi:MFS family permease